MAQETRTRMTSAQRGTMLAVILGSGVVFLDTSVVTLALPQIAEEMPSDTLAALEAQSYVANGYFLTLSALLVLAGAFSDYYGRKRMFSLGLVGFAVTSLLCGLAPNVELLIAFRVLQGAAGALVVPGSLAILTSTFSGEQQGRAFGYWAGASAFSAILGPPIGGLLVNTVSWRAVFLINLPLLVVAYLATARHMQESRDEDASRHFDWIGSVLVAVAVGGLAFGTIRGQATRWTGIEAYVSLGLGAIAAIAFPIWILRARNPLVPPRLFKSRNFTVTNLSTFVIYGALYILLVYQPLFMVSVLGYNEQAAAVAGLPASVLLALFSARFGKLAARYGPRFFMAAGPAIMGLGLLWFLRIRATSDPWVLAGGSGGTILPPADYFVDIFPAFVVFGVGLTIMVAPLTTALMTSVPTRNSGVASAINNAISRVGAPLVGALIFVAATAGFYATIADRVPGAPVDTPRFRQEVSPLNRPAPAVPEDVRVVANEASTDAFHVTVLVAASLMFAGAAINAIGIRNRTSVPMDGGRDDRVTGDEPHELPAPQPTPLPDEPRTHPESP